MIFSRLLSLILRVAQFVFAAVVLGLSAYFMYERTRRGVGPFGRTIYTIIWSSLSVLFSIIWMIPTKSTMASYGSDLGKSSPLDVHSSHELCGKGVCVSIANTQKSLRQVGPQLSRCWCAGSMAQTAAARGRGPESVCRAATTADSGRRRRPSLS